MRCLEHREGESNTAIAFSIHGKYDCKHDIHVQLDSVHNHHPCYTCCLGISLNSKRNADVRIPRFNQPTAAATRQAKHTRSCHAEKVLNMKLNCHNCNFPCTQQELNQASQRERDDKQTLKLHKWLQPKDQARSGQGSKSPQRQMRSSVQTPSLAAKPEVPGWTGVPRLGAALTGA